jgi:hypothetical protein
MGPRPTQGDEKRLLSQPPSMEASPFPLSSRLSRLPRLAVGRAVGAPRISYYAAPEMATCAAFIEESRMKFADHTKLDRKSGEAEGSAVPRTLLGNVFRQSVAKPQYPPGNT